MPNEEEETTTPKEAEEENNPEVKKTKVELDEEAKQEVRQKQDPRFPTHRGEHNPQRVRRFAIKPNRPKKDDQPTQI